MTLKNIPLITFHVGERVNQYFVSDGQNQLSAQTLKKRYFLDII
jgi:hypothetical protein